VKPLLTSQAGVPLEPWQHDSKEVVKSSIPDAYLSGSNCVPKVEEDLCV
jgi:hypothetical protein